MKVADFGCSVGLATRMLAEIVGPTGSATGIDLSAAQLERARALFEKERLTNTHFVEASAYSTGLECGSFDLVYCGFLLLHLTDPAACLREMRDLLRPGGVLVVEEATSRPREVFPRPLLTHLPICLVASGQRAGSITPKATIFIN